MLGLGALLFVSSAIVDIDVAGRTQPARGYEPVLAATTTIRWAGYTTTTYSGTLGDAVAERGVRAGASICQANYSGSVWADADQIIKLGTSYPWTQAVWLADFYGIPTYDCFHYTDGTVSRFASCADTKSIYPGSQSVCSCNVARYLPCVYIP